jgi:hypothetical protein
VQISIYEIWGQKTKTKRFVENRPVFLVYRAIISFLGFDRKFNFQTSEKKTITVRFYRKLIVFSGKRWVFSPKPTVITLIRRWFDSQIEYRGHAQARSSLDHGQLLRLIMP